MSLAQIAITAGGALVGGLGNAFSGNSEDEKIDKYIEMLNRNRQRIIDETKQSQVDMRRNVSSMKKEKLVQANEKAAELGLSPTSTPYSAVEGLDNAEIQAQATLKENETKQLNDLANKIAEAELGKSNDSWLERFGEGAAQGLNLGSQVTNMLTSTGILGDKAQTAVKSTVTNTPVNTNAPIVPEVNVPNNSIYGNLMKNIPFDLKNIIKPTNFLLGDPNEIIKPKKNRKLANKFGVDLNLESIKEYFSRFKPDYFEMVNQTE
jgi:hypothetical protein